MHPSVNFLPNPNDVLRGLNVLGIFKGILCGNENIVGNLRE